MSDTSTAEDWIVSLREPLQRYARSLGLSAHDAEDAVQEALIALSLALEKNPSSIRNRQAYAFTVVRNNANKRFRERARRNEVEMPEEHPEAPSEPDKFEEPLLRQSFQKAYGKLSPFERDLIRKYYVEGRTYEQLGAEMGCSAQNVWKLLKKIVSQFLAGELKKSLTELDPEFAKELFNR